MECGSNGLLCPKSSICASNLPGSGAKGGCMPDGATSAGAGTDSHCISGWFYNATADLCQKNDSEDETTPASMNMNAVYRRSANDKPNHVCQSLVNEQSSALQCEPIEEGEADEAEIRASLLVPKSLTGGKTIGIVVNLAGSLCTPTKTANINAAITALGVDVKILELNGIPMASSFNVSDGRHGIFNTQGVVIGFGIKNGRAELDIEGCINFPGMSCPGQQPAEAADRLSENEWPSKADFVKFKNKIVNSFNTLENKTKRVIKKIKSQKWVQKIDQKVRDLVKEIIEKVKTQDMNLITGGRVKWGFDINFLASACESVGISPTIDDTPSAAPLELPQLSDEDEEVEIADDDEEDMEESQEFDDDVSTTGGSAGEDAVVTDDEAAGTVLP